MAELITIGQNNGGQRIDNFLVTYCKGVPKGRIYRALRKGEVRVNKSRVDQIYRLKEGDEVRVPPFRRSEEVRPQAVPENYQWLESYFLYEDDDLIVVNKPSGLPVHGGSNVSLGLIESLGCLRPYAKFLKLVHRLDKETSGCLLVAKNRQTLLALQELLLTHQIEKNYMTLVKGKWKRGEEKIEMKLKKNYLESGERKVKITEEGKLAQTIFKPLQKFKIATLLNAKILTGRTHQIRVQAVALGHPIAGDEKYGDHAFNRYMRQQGLKRLFLHAAQLKFKLKGKLFNFEAKLPEALSDFLNQLN